MSGPMSREQMADLMDALDLFGMVKGLDTETVMYGALGVSLAALCGERDKVEAVLTAIASHPSLVDIITVMLVGDDESDERTLQ